MLVDEGTAIVKVYLHVSQEEQRTRLQSGWTTPETLEVRAGDLNVNERYDEYVAAYEEAITRRRLTGRRGASFPPIATGSRRTRPQRSCADARATRSEATRRRLDSPYVSASSSSVNSGWAQMSPVKVSQAPGLPLS